MSQVTDPDDIDQIKALAEKLLTTKSKWDRRQGFSWYTRTLDETQRENVKEKVFMIMKQERSA